jgi:beta-glucosidase
MKELNLGTYRFSTSWARVRPDGGAVNPQGVDFYSRLVDELLAHDIKPWLTLYHWDLPQALEERGGWANRDTAYLFAEYAVTMHEALGDRVDVWTTLNEPWCASFLSYTAGVHAPGRQSRPDGLAAAHHLMLGHGLAVRELRARDSGANLGITLNLTVADPVDPQDPADVDAARRIDGQFNRIFLDPILRGSYPADVLADVEDHGLPEHVRDGDLEVISSPIDTLGVNYYHGEMVGARPAEHTLQSDAPVQRATSSLHEEYTGPAGVALYVTENGAAYDDVPDPDGYVEDTERLQFFDLHLRAVHEAVRRGVDVRGYFAWSLMDNYEWAWGYHKRFGIVRVDYETLERTPKASGRWYASVARDNALPPLG